MTRYIRENQLLYYLVSFSIVLTLTLLVFFIAQGKRLNIEERTIEGTGILNVKSHPDGSRILLDGIARGATNSTVSGIREGLYNLQVVKEGFVTWQKNVPIFNGLVTNVDALLISKTPRLEPLTNIGVESPTLSHSSTRIAFLTQDAARPGIYIISLSQNIPINIFRTSASLFIEDTFDVLYSEAMDLWWSPDDNEILIKMDDELYYLLDTNQPQTVPEATTSALAIFEEWDTEIQTRREILLERRRDIEIPGSLREKMLDPQNNDNWSPDGEMFLYMRETEEGLEYRVYNLETPLSVGGQRDYLTLKVTRDDLKPVNIHWYIDSRHLIIVYGEFGEDVEIPRGSVYIVEVDGNNYTEIYSGQMTSPVVFPTPQGDKLIITATFRGDTPAELYSISIR